MDLSILKIVLSRLFSSKSNKNSRASSKKIMSNCFIYKVIESFYTKIRTYKHHSGLLDYPRLKMGAIASSWATLMQTFGMPIAAGHPINRQFNKTSSANIHPVLPLSGAQDGIFAGLAANLMQETGLPGVSLHTSPVMAVESFFLGSAVFKVPISFKCASSSPPQTCISEGRNTLFPVNFRQFKVRVFGFTGLLKYISACRSVLYPSHFAYSYFITIPSSPSINVFSRSAWWRSWGMVSSRMLSGL